MNANDFSTREMVAMELEATKSGIDKEQREEIVAFAIQLVSEGYTVAEAVTEAIIEVDNE